LFRAVGTAAILRRIAAIFLAVTLGSPQSHFSFAFS
jgi:hypothetical protein